MIVDEWIASRQGLTPENVTHVVIPGRGRSEDGMDLSAITAARVDFAAEFYIGQRLAERRGVIICAANKTPADQNGEPWSDGRETFQGKPEAYSMRDRLLAKYALNESHIIVEPRSFDTPTDLAFARGRLPDQWGAVGIVAQREHLERMMTHIVPRLFGQSVIGLVVPELADKTDHDTLFAQIATRISMFGLQPQTPHISERIAARSCRTWAAVLYVQRLRSKARGALGHLGVVAE